MVYGHTHQQQQRGKEQSSTLELFLNYPLFSLCSVMIVLSSHRVELEFRWKMCFSVLFFQPVAYTIVISIISHINIPISLKAFSSPPEICVLLVVIVELIFMHFLFITISLDRFIVTIFLRSRSWTLDCNPFSNFIFHQYENKSACRANERYPRVEM